MITIGDETGRAGNRKRSVRSFVRRTGRMTPGQQRAIDKLWPQYGIDYSPEALRFENEFGRDAPLALEIGFGNGETLVSQAAASPEVDFIGIEVHRPGLGHCMLHADIQGLSNLRLICHDALDVLKNQICNETLSRVNLYFPDPWPKKRHHKRRIVQIPFLQLVALKLTKDGSFRIATDWSEYAHHIDEVVTASGCFRIGERREHAGDSALDRPTTRFEQRGLGKGHTIFDWRLERI